MIQRLEYIDFCRGIAILLVVIGHLIQFNGIATSNPVFEFIYSFHMPLFFAISGYITQKVTHIETGKQYLLYLKKKSIAILLPLLSWTLLANNYLLAEHWKLLTFDDIWMTIMNPGLWFLKMLFVILMIYGLSNWINHKIKSKKTISFVLSLIPVILITVLAIVIRVEEINLLLFSYAFYLGCFIARSARLEQIIMKDTYYAIITMCFFVLATHWFFGGDMMDDLYKVIISTCAFIFLLNLSRKIHIPTLIYSQIQKFGFNSLAIYILQFYFCKISLYELIGWGGVNPFILVLMCLVVAIFICYTCLFVAKCISTSKILNFILLGKK